MTHFTKNENFSSDLCIHQYSGIDKDALAKKVDTLFTSSGYILSPGRVPGNGVYEKGNRTLRILFGAFVKYFKFSVMVGQGQDGVLRVSVGQQTSGMSGGLIGMNQVKNEMKRIAAALQGI